jgi:NtrC-family two-component system response regulator AlgB
MRVLIIDDEASIRQTMAMLLESLGHEAVSAANRTTALRQLDKGAFDIAFLDLKLDGEDGLDLLPELNKSHPYMDVVVFTAYASPEMALTAGRLGVNEILHKPFTPEQVRQMVLKVGENRKLKGRKVQLEDRLATDSPHADLHTREPVMQRVVNLAFKASATPASIMILGESGTGKTVLARAIHERSPQRDNAFVTISCPSLSRELLESELFGRVKGAYTGASGDAWGKVALAEGGTLFLDEIGELPLEIQPKLLRLLQEKEYERLGEAKTRRANLRVIAATNRDLEHAVREGRFREDLFYRLNVITLRLPPLRERLADLHRLATGYLKFFSAQCAKHIKGFSPDTERAMRQYAWPGNVRELRNVVEHAVILANGDEIVPDDLPDKLTQLVAGLDGMRAQVGMQISLEELEQAHIRRILAQSSSMEEAARILGIGRSTLYKKTKQ